MAATGVQSQEIARKPGISRPTIQFWRQRFLGLRLAGLEKDAPHLGRIPRISDRRVRRLVEATLHNKPENAPHWSTRLMAKAQGVSEATVRRIWKQHNLKPHLTKTFKLSRDQQFVEKLYDVVELYLNPPNKSLVLCVYEKSQIQALDRTKPGLPLKMGRYGTMTQKHSSGERKRHAFVDHGSGSLSPECEVVVHGVGLSSVAANPVSMWLTRIKTVPFPRNPG